MTLTGETEVITDHAERFVGELQQMFSLFQFTAQDKCTECETELFFEIGRKIRTAETDMIRDLGGSDRAVDVLKNILDRPLKRFVGSFWDQFVFYFLCKSQKHLEIQILDSRRII